MLKPLTRPCVAGSSAAASMTRSARGANGLGRILQRTNQWDVRSQETAVAPVDAATAYANKTVTYIELAQRTFSRRKKGHVHDKSAYSENVPGAREPNVHMHFIFHFEIGHGNQSSLSVHDQNTAETSQPQAQPTDDRQGISTRPPAALRKVWFSTAY